MAEEVRSRQSLSVIMSQAEQVSFKPRFKNDLLRESQFPCAHVYLFFFAVDFEMKQKHVRYQCENVRMQSVRVMHIADSVVSLCTDRHMQQPVECLNSRTRVFFALIRQSVDEADLR